MPDNTSYPTDLLTLAPEIISTPSASKRAKFAAFARDEASAKILQDALEPVLPYGAHFQVMDFRTSLRRLAGMKTPEIVLIDLSGEEQPINALMDLADAVDQGTTVLAIGEVQNVSFYRTITKGMGIKEYLPKPLTRQGIEKHFLSLLDLEITKAPPARGGRFITVTGARGGVGASTIASNLAWMIGTDLHRHTVLLDSDLYAGTTSLDLDVKPTSGLVRAMEVPDRLDNLLLERATQPVTDRVHVLAAQENFGSSTHYEEQSAASVVDALRARYNFVIADAGAKLCPFSRDLLHLAQQRIIVLDPTVVSIRNTERLLTLPGEAANPGPTLLVLNRARTPGGLTQDYMEQVLGRRFDAVIPYLPNVIPKASQFGTIPASLRGPFRAAMGELAALFGAVPVAVAA